MTEEGGRRLVAESFNGLFIKKYLWLIDSIDSISSMVQCKLVVILLEKRVVHTQCGRFDRVLGGAQKCSDRCFCHFCQISIVLDLATTIIDHIPLFRLHVITCPQFSLDVSQFIMFPINNSKMVIKTNGIAVCDDIICYRKPIFRFFASMNNISSTSIIYCAPPLVLDSAYGPESAGG